MSREVKNDFENELGIDDSVNFSLDLGSNAEEDLVLDLDYYDEEDSEVLLDLDDKTLTDIAVEQAIEEEDSHLLVAGLAGIDSHTGGSIKSATSLATTIINSDVDFTITETEVKRELTPFSEEELAEVNNIISSIMKNSAYEENKKLQLKIDEELEITNININEIYFKINQSRIEFNEQHPFIELAKKRFAILKKAKETKKISPAEAEFIKGVTEATIVEEYNRARQLESRMARKAEELKEMLDTQKKIDQEIMDNRIKTQKSLNNLLTLTEEKLVKPIMEKVKKINFIEFGFKESYKDKNKNTVFPITVECECGGITHASIENMPYYVSGDIYGDFNERGYINNSVRKNLVKNTDIIKSGDTRHKLHKDNNIIGSRIHIPGVSDGKSENVLLCTSCQGNLIFHPSIIERLARHGFVSDTLLLETVKSGVMDWEDIQNGVRIFLYEELVDSSYKTDLGLIENVRSIRGQISSDIKAVDSVSKKNYRNTINERVLNKYAKRIGSNGSMEEIEIDLRGHINNLKEAINELRKEYKEPKGKNAEKYKIRNAYMRRFLNNSEGLIIKYALDKGLSHLAIKNEINQYKDNISDFKKVITEHLVEELVESTINGESALVFEGTVMKNIEGGVTGLPHVNFFKCYKSVLRNHLMRELTSGSIANNIKNSNDKEKLKYTYLADLFRELNKISFIEDHKERIRQSEKIVFKYRELFDTRYKKPEEDFFNLEDPKEKEQYEKQLNLHNSYSKSKVNLLLNYLKDIENTSACQDENNRLQSWVYFDLLVIGKKLNGMEVSDPTLFEEIYGQKLKEMGIENYFV